MNWEVTDSCGCPAPVKCGGLIPGENFHFLERWAAQVGLQEVVGLEGQICYETCFSADTDGGRAVMRCWSVPWHKNLMPN